jgi:8-oxo-dGTP pyrophosphatase MutT (NUDIX family)
MTDWPKIKMRRVIEISPWMEIVEREVEFAPGASPETYHAVGQQDYIAIVARTPDGLLPIVRQYRPALEQFTWELPAGMVDKGEDAADCCRRELLEETGFHAITVHALGCYAPCSARLSNRIHSFFVETTARAAAPASEPGIDHKLVTPAELAGLIASGEFPLQLHIGAILLAGLAGHLDIADFRMAGPSRPAKP